jgi:hypothetical protein
LTYNPAIYQGDTLLHSELQRRHRLVAPDAGWIAYQAWQIKAIIVTKTIDRIAIRRMHHPDC